MPQHIQNIGETSPKQGTYQYSDNRVSDLILKLPSGVSEISNRRIVSVQESSKGIQYAIPGTLAFEEKAASGTTPAVKMTVLRVGVLEYALQSGGVDSISAKSDVLKDGDRVVVLSNVNSVYMIDYLSTAKPAKGKGDITDSNGSICRVDNQGRLVSTASTTAAPLGEIFGSVFYTTPGNQLGNQLLDNTAFYKLFSTTQA